MGGQHERIVPLRVWFRSMARHHHILHNPASELELPRLGIRLPKAVLTAKEAEQILVQPDIHDPLGMRDRAILETLYSTGMRRLELVSLKVWDLALERATAMIRQGKGKKIASFRSASAPRRGYASTWTHRVRSLSPNPTTKPFSFPTPGRRSRSIT